MKIIFLISLAFLGISLLGADRTDSYAVVRVLGSSPMPPSFWSNPEGGFTTFEDALDLAKINALSDALENPEGDNGMCSLCSAFSYNAGILLNRKKNVNEQFGDVLQKFMIYCSREDNGEGHNIQSIARQLRKRIDEQGESFMLYNEWLHRNKKSHHTSNILSYIDTYFKTKNETFIEEFFYFLQAQVVVDVAQLEELAK